MCDWHVFLLINAFICAIVTATVAATDAFSMEVSLLCVLLEEANCLSVCLSVCLCVRLSVPRYMYISLTHEWKTPEGPQLMSRSEMTVGRRVGVMGQMVTWHRLWRIDVTVVNVCKSVFCSGRQWLMLSLSSLRSVTVAWSEWNIDNVSTLIFKRLTLL